MYVCTSGWPCPAGSYVAADSAVEAELVGRRAETPATGGRSLGGWIRTTTADRGRSSPPVARARAGQALTPTGHPVPAQQPTARTG